MERSPIDELFFELYGYYPKKTGQAYEMLVAASFKLLFDIDIDYNQMLKGNYSDTIFQLDGLISKEQGKIIIEAKDYTINNRKVGRGDLQKFQGALTDLPVDSGIFASATHFTKPALKYASSSKSNPFNKEIDLFHIRPSIEKDEEGRVKRIVISIFLDVENYEKGKYKPIFTKSGIEMLKSNGIKNNFISMKLRNFYDKYGNIIFNVADLTKNYSTGTFWESDYVAKGCWNVKGYIKVYDRLCEIEGIEYEVPHSVFKQEVVIEAEGNPKIYVKSLFGSVDKLITDEELKKIEFKNGKVIKK